MKRTDKNEWIGLVCLLVALISVNLFYTSDLLNGEGVITLGPKSLMAIAAANMLGMVGLLLIVIHRGR